MLLKICRHFCGWDEIIDIPRKNAVAVWTHTTYWDAFLMLLYKDAPIQFISVWNPRYFNSFTRPILHALRVIEAPRLEDRGLGGVSILVEQLKQFLRPDLTTILLISPKGTIAKKPWRTGYAFIAKALNWPVRAMLVNYEKKTISFGAEYTLSDLSIEKVGPLTASLQYDLSNSVTLIQERSEIRETPHDAFELMCCVDPLCLSNLCMLPPVVVLLSRFDPFGFIALAACIVSSFYHKSKEAKYKDLDALMAKIVIGGSLMRYWQNFRFLQASLLTASIFAFVSGQPRVPENKRGPYIVYHTIFHVLISLTAYSLVF